MQPPRSRREARSRRRHAAHRAQGSEAARLAWARGGALLALCDARGGLALHDAATGGSLTVLDRHARGVTCVGWGAGGCLALGGRDCQARGPSRGISQIAPDMCARHQAVWMQAGPQTLLSRQTPIRFMCISTPLLLSGCRTWQEYLQYCVAERKEWHNNGWTIPSSPAWVSAWVQVSVSEDGAADMHRAWDVRGEPRELAFREREGGAAGAVSVNVAGRSVWVFEARALDMFCVCISYVWLEQ